MPHGFHLQAGIAGKHGERHGRRSSRSPHRPRPSPRVPLPACGDCRASDRRHWLRRALRPRPFVRSKLARVGSLGCPFPAATRCDSGEHPVEPAASHAQVTPIAPPDPPDHDRLTSYAALRVGVGASPPPRWSDGPRLTAPAQRGCRVRERGGNVRRRLIPPHCHQHSRFILSAVVICTGARAASTAIPRESAAARGRSSSGT